MTDISQLNLIPQVVPDSQDTDSKSGKFKSIREERKLFEQRLEAKK
jgi:hypothetical protein